MKTSLKQKLNLTTKTTRQRLALVAVSIGVLGALIVLITRAASTPAVLEAETAAVTGNARPVEDIQASNGKALRFGQASTTPNPGGNSNTGAYQFPLKVSGNGRHLVDQGGRAFLYVADTAWSLLEYNSTADIKRYIDIRASQGFSVIQTNLIWDLYNQKGAQRAKAFNSNDFKQPNEAYWAGIDEAMGYAESKGIVLSVGLLWFSKHGGWEPNGPSPSESDFAAYATWVGNRYKSQGNILWVIGGDDELYRNEGVKKAGANALKAADPGHLITYHPREKEYGLRTEGWLGYNSYQWNANLSPWTYQGIREGRDLSPVKPILNAEPPYVPNPCCGGGETTALKNRWNGWWAILAGSMGVTFGGGQESWGIGWNGTNWGQYAQKEPGHTGKIRTILNQFAWDKLSPDWDNAAVTGGRGSYGGTDYVAAGRADDGSLIVAYTPSERTLQVDLSKLSGAGTAQWYDPASGQALGSPETVTNTGSKSFATPGSNSDGASDWVLVIKKN